MRKMKNIILMVHFYCGFQGVLKFLLLGCIVMGINPFQQIGFGHIGANVWTWMFTNKIYAALMTFFLANFIENTLISTGAFEIFFNDVPVWSKLQTGKIMRSFQYSKSVWIYLSNLFSRAILIYILFCMYFTQVVSLVHPNYSKLLTTI